MRGNNPDVITVIRIIDTRRNRTGNAAGSCRKVVHVMYFVCNRKWQQCQRDNEYKLISCSLISCFTSEEGCHLSLVPLCSIASALLWVFPALHSSLMMFAARSNWWHPLQSSHWGFHSSHHFATPFQRSSPGDLN